MAGRFRHHREEEIPDDAWIRRETRALVEIVVREHARAGGIAAHAREPAVDEITRRCLPRALADTALLDRDPRAYFDKLVARILREADALLLRGEPPHEPPEERRARRERYLAGLQEEIEAARSTTAGPAVVHSIGEALRRRGKLTPENVRAAVATYEARARHYLAHPDPHRSWPHAEEVVASLFDPG